MRESREKKREAELLSVLLMEEDEDEEKEKGRDGIGLSEGYVNVYGPEIAVANSAGLVAAGGSMRSSTVV